MYCKNNKHKGKGHIDSEKEIIFGKNACFGCLKGSRRVIYGIYLLSIKWNEYYNQIPEKYKPLCRKCNAHEMFTITHDDRKHQGIALKVSKYNFLQIEDLFHTEKVEDSKEKYSALFLLDRVQDPHNVGNIIRTAYCLNIDGLILTERNACGITAAVVRTSAGYSESSNIYQVSNIMQTVEKLKKNGYWIIGFDVNTNAKNNLRNVITNYNKCVFIFGSEGNGVKDTLKKSCDIILKLPMKNGAESLNVANTTAIVAWEWMNKIINHNQTIT